MAGKSNPFLKKATGAQKAPVRVEGDSGKKKTHGLGRGLDGLLKSQVPPVAVSSSVAVFPNAAAPAASGQPFELKIANIDRSPYQPRHEFKEEDLKELAESLKNTGLVHPPTVRRTASGRYELISGERRLRAAQLAGWEKIRVTLIDADDMTAALMTTSENLQREDLNPIEEAISYKTLQDSFSLTQADVAERVGKGRATVANALRLLELPDEVKALVQSGLLSVGHAKVLLSLDAEKDRVLLARDCVNEQLTVRALEKRIERMRNPPEVKKHGEPDLPDSYVHMLTDKMKRYLGCAVRLTSGVTHANGKHTKGVLEIDFFDNDELDRIIQMIGVKVD